MGYHNSLRQNEGFTLLDLAIALVVFGLLAGAFFSAASIYVKQKRAENMEVRLDAVSTAMARYIKKDPNDASDPGRFPCPASLTVPQGAAGYGVEVCPNFSATYAAGDDLGGVLVLSGPSGLVLAGAIPTATLGINGNLMLDEYGNRFTYAVTMDLVREDALLEEPAYSPAITRHYKEELPDKTIVDKVAAVNFMIISHGPDGAGSYTKYGKRNGNACRITDPIGMGDSRNCVWQTNFEPTFRDEAYTYSTATTAGFYDDLAIHLLGEDQTGWWQSSDDAGGNIVAKNNIENIGIGPGIINPVQTVDVAGAIKIADTENVCNSASVGSIRYNSGAKNVVECCNSSGGAGYGWGDISYGCSTGVCSMATKGQLSFNAATKTRQYCNGVKFISIFGSNCSGGAHYHGEIFNNPPTIETVPCDGGLSGTMSRSRSDQSFCNNGTIEVYAAGAFSDWNRSGCAFGNPAGYEVTRFGVASGCNNDWSSCFRNFAYPAPACASGTARGYACETHPGGCDNQDGTCCVVCN